jgi:hypothetical protein
MSMKKWRSTLITLVIQAEPIKTFQDKRRPSVKWQNEQVSAFSEIRQVG